MEAPNGGAGRQAWWWTGGQDDELTAHTEKESYMKKGIMLLYLYQFFHAVYNMLFVPLRRKKEEEQGDGGREGGRKENRKLCI